MTQILLERMPEYPKQNILVAWLIRCVCGGVCGVDVISLILKSIKWDEEVKNVIIGLLINAWDIAMNEDVFKSLLETVPLKELGMFLTKNFDQKSLFQ